MKKAVLISLIPIFIFLFPLGIMTGGFILMGCAPDNGDNIIENPVSEGDNIFSLSIYPYLNQLLGYPTTHDFANGIYLEKEMMDTLASQGYLNKEDWNWFYDTLWWLYCGMDEIDNEFAAKDPNEVHSFGLWQDTIVDLADTAQYTDIGTVLNQLFDQVGVDFLTHHVHSMLEYLFAMDDATWERTILYKFFDIMSTDGRNKISEDDFNTLMEVFKRMIDKDDEVYGMIWEEVPSIHDIINTLKEHGDVTVQDIKDLISYLLAPSDDIDPNDAATNVDQATEELMEALSETMDEVWEHGELVLKQRVNEDGNLEDLEEEVVLTFKGNLRNLLYSIALLMTQEKSLDNEFNEWDHIHITDLSRMLYGVEELLDPNLGDELEAFLTALITYSAAMDGADSLNGILNTYINPAYLAVLDDSIGKMFKHNIDDNPRGDGDISAIRLVIFTFKTMDLDNVGEIVSFAFSSQEGTVHRKNFLDWAMGEIATSLMRYPEDPFDGYDFLFYNKTYGVMQSCYPWFGEVLCFQLGTFEGLFNLLESAPVQTLLNVSTFDQFIPVVFAAFGVDKTNHPGETGFTNQIMVMASLIKHFYTTPHPNHDSDGWRGDKHGWENTLLNMITSFNEINNLVYHNEVNASGVLKTVEGPYGYGLATYALRSHDPDGLEPRVDNGLLDSVLYLVSMTVNELQNTDYGDGTLWNALMDHIKTNKLLGLDVDTLDDKNGSGDYKIISDLFDPDENGNIAIQTAHKSLKNIHELIAAITKDFVGAVLKKVTENEEIYQKIIDDIDTIKPIIEDITEIDFDTDFDPDSITVLKDYLLAENPDGSDNKFVANLKAIIHKILDLKVDTTKLNAYEKGLYKNYASVEKGKDSEYQYQGTKDNNCKLKDLLEHLTGDEELEGGVYSVSNVMDFVEELQNLNVDLFGYFIEDTLRELLVDNPSNVSDETTYDFIKVFAGPAISNSEMFRWMRSCTTWADMDNNGILDQPVIYNVVSVPRLETDINEVLGELVYFLDGSGYDLLRPDGTLWRILKKAFKGSGEIDFPGSYLSNEIPVD